MRKRFWYMGFGAAMVLLLAMLPTDAVASPIQQGENLLQNPSFEGQYSAWNGIPQLQMPAAWTPWWTERSSSDPEWANHRPEWKPAEGEFYPNRVHGGTRAIQWFKSYATYNCGAYQQVNVPANAHLKFSAFAQAWSCDSWDSCPDATSHDPANMRMQIGIDPTGGTNPWAGTVVWSYGINPLDAWGYLEVEATAQGGMVTVYLRSNPDWPKQNQDSYFDDASLVVIGAPAPAEPTAAPAQPAPAAPAATPVPAVPFVAATPQADGSIVHTVQAHETLWSIAVNYGIGLDELRSNNDIGDFIYEGQQLVIQPPTAGAAAAEATSEPEPEVETEPEVDAAADGGTTTEPEPESTAEVTETEAEVVAADEASAAKEGVTTTAAVCVSAYDDENANGAQDNSEGLLAGVQIAISDGMQVLGNYMTDGASEPYCFTGLNPGSYQVIEQVGDGWQPTNLTAWGISLNAGDTTSLAFGSARVQESQEESPEAPIEPAPAAAAEDSGDTRLRTSVFTGLGVIGLLLIIGAGLFMVLSRRA